MSVKKYYPVLIRLCFLLSLIYFFSGIFFGLDFTDGFFHINVAISNEETYPYPFFLSSYIIRILIDLFGYDLLTLRIINALLYVLAVLIPWTFFRNSTTSDRSLFYLTVVLFLISPLNANILGYDTLSVFMLSVAFTLMVLYLKKPGVTMLLLLVITSVIAVLIRLPNIMLIPVVFTGILFSNKESKVLSYKNSCLFLFLALGGIALGYKSYYATITLMLTSWEDAGAHSWKLLLLKYIHDGVELFLILFCIYVIHYIYKFKLSQKREWALLFSICMHVLLLFLYVLFSGYSRNYSLYLTALFLFLILNPLFSKKSPSGQRIILILFCLFLFIMPFGSNTGLLKASFLLVLIPAVFSVVPFKSDKYLVVLLLINIPAAILEKAFNVYEDRNIVQLNQPMDIALLYGIHTNQLRYEYIKTIDKTVRELQEKGFKVYFYGDKSHMFNYLYPEETLNSSSFFQPESSLQLFPAIIEKIKEDKPIAIFVINAYPNQIIVDKVSVLEVELINKGFQRVNTGAGKYYTYLED